VVITSSSSRGEDPTLGTTILSSSLYPVLVSPELMVDKEAVLQEGKEKVKR
jgi:hypothetical protein